MINRYKGNSGKYTRIEDASFGFVQSPAPRAPERNVPPGAGTAREKNGSRQNRQPFRSSGILEKLFSLIPGNGIRPAGLESEDIILMLILYLMYKESGDSELLMIMGAMFLM